MICFCLCFRAQLPDLQAKNPFLVETAQFLHLSNPKFLFYFLVVELFQEKE
jgi:hypothetical protein